MYGGNPEGNLLLVLLLGDVPSVEPWEVLEELPVEPEANGIEGEPIVALASG